MAFSLANTLAIAADVPKSRPCSLFQAACISSRRAGLHLRVAIGQHPLQALEAAYFCRELFSLPKVGPGIIQRGQANAQGQGANPDAPAGQFRQPLL